MTKKQVQRLIEVQCLEIRHLRQTKTVGGIVKRHPININRQEMNTYKPDNYNSLSPYLIVDNAQKLVDLLKVIFNATELRRFDHENGTIAHIELKLDDTIIMISNSTDTYAANKTMLHFYVPDVFKTFDLAVDNGCEIIEKPIKKAGDSDTRGSFYDCSGNYWSVSSQTN